MLALIGSAVADTMSAVSDLGESFVAEAAVADALA